MNPDRLFGDHGEPERHQQAQDRIGVVEPPQDEALEENAEQRHRDRRQHHRRTEAEIFRDLDGNVGAERIERAVREIDDAADAERSATGRARSGGNSPRAPGHSPPAPAEIRTAFAIRKIKKRRRRLFCAGAATPVCPTPDSGFYAFMLQGFCVFVG
jgi:hypothetical protein